MPVLRLDEGAFNGSAAKKVTPAQRAVRRLDETALLGLLQQRVQILSPIAAFGIDTDHGAMILPSLVTAGLGEQTTWP